jgi:hypothetical protein
MAQAQLDGEFGVEWAVGLTTVPSRRALLERTLASVAAAGFPRPHLFVDGARTFETDLEATCRWPAVLTWANWFLGLTELIARRPFAHFYLMLQDDLVMCRGVREYLEARPWPKDGYANLYTAPENASREPGWRETRDVARDPERNIGLQGGRGALALAFDRRAAMAMLAAPSATRKLVDLRPEFRVKRADGGIVTAMNLSGFREYVHAPSLVQHTGTISSMGNGWQAPSSTFLGEDFDARALLELPCSGPMA